MPDFPTSHVKLRKVVNSLLGSDDLVGKFWRVEHIATAIYNSSAISVESSVLSAEVKTAYGVGDVNTEEVANTTHVVFAKKTRDGRNTTRVTYVGRFESIESAESADSNYNPPRNINMSEEDSGLLNAFLLMRQQKKQKRQNSKKKTTNEPKKATAPSQRKRKKPEESEEEQQRKKNQEREKEMADLRAQRRRHEIKVSDLYEKKKKVEEELAKIRLEVAEIEEKLGEKSTCSVPTGDDGDGRTLYYIKGGRIGKFQYDGGVIFPDDIANNYEPYPEGYGDEEQHEKNRMKRTYKAHSHGSSQYWLPPGAMSEAKNQHGKKEDAHTKVHNLGALFSGKQMSLEDEHLKWAAACNIQGYGSSDQATEMIKLGWTKTLLEALDIKDISAEEGEGERIQMQRRVVMARVAVKMIEATSPLPVRASTWVHITLSLGKQLHWT